MEDEEDGMEGDEGREGRIIIEMRKKEVMKGWDLKSEGKNGVEEDEIDKIIGGERIGEKD